MTVGELIEKLSKLDKDLPVKILNEEWNTPVDIGDIEKDVWLTPYGSGPMVVIEQK